MDVGHDWNARRLDDLAERRRAFHVRAGNADEVSPGFLAAADLVDRRDRVAGQRIGHGLHRDRRVAADGDLADHDLAGLAARDIAPGADGRHEAPIQRPAERG
jgi:hypothetical protein